MNRESSERPQWRWHLPVWTVIVAVVLALISAGEHYIEMGEQGRTTLGWAHAFEFRMPFWVLWAMLAPLVALVARNAARRPLSTQIVSLAGAGVGLAAVHALLEYGIQSFLAPQFF